jgi:WD40 repeat protein
MGASFQGHEDSVSSVAFSPDGQMIVTVSYDYTVRLWDLQGTPLSQPLKGHQDLISAVAFSPDSQMIISGSFDKTLRLWRASWKSWLKVCCDRLRYHPVFKNPQTKIEKQACETCRKYVWSKEDTSV